MAQSPINHRLPATADMSAGNPFERIDIVTEWETQ